MYGKEGTSEFTPLVLPGLGQPDVFTRMKTAGTETPLAVEEPLHKDRFGQAIVPGVVCTYGYGPYRSFGVVKEVFEDGFSFYSGQDTWEMNSPRGPYDIKRPHVTQVRRIYSVVVLPHVKPEDIGLTLVPTVIARFTNG